MSLAHPTISSRVGPALPALLLLSLAHPAPSRADPALAPHCPCRRSAAPPLLSLAHPALPPLSPRAGSVLPLSSPVSLVSLFGTFRHPANVRWFQIGLGFLLAHLRCVEDTATCKQRTCLGCLEEKVYCGLWPAADPRVFYPATSLIAHCHSGIGLGKPLLLGLQFVSNCRPLLPPSTHRGTNTNTPVAYLARRLTSTAASAVLSRGRPLINSCATSPGESCCELEEKCYLVLRTLLRCWPFLSSWYQRGGSQE